MEYTSNLFVKFIEELIDYSRACKLARESAAERKRNRKDEERKAWNVERAAVDQRLKKYVSEADHIYWEVRDREKTTAFVDLKRKEGIFERLHKCKRLLAEITNAENSILNREGYDANKMKSSSAVQASVDELLEGKIDFISMAYHLNEVLQTKKQKEMETVCSAFYSACRTAEEALEVEIQRLRSESIKNKGLLETDYQNLMEESWKQIQEIQQNAVAYLDRVPESIDRFKSQSDEKLKAVEESWVDDLRRILRKKEEEFCKQFPPQEFLAEYQKIYSLEPVYDSYSCYTEMPLNVHISNLEYDMANMQLNEDAISLLKKYYYFMVRNHKLCIPYCASFGSEFNYAFHFQGEKREKVVSSACDLGMRLFMMLPPGKVKFTFVDPITLGESFAMFTRLVDVDDRTSEIINGKIWSSQTDIEQKLRIMTDHIANVTQRCLQGKYHNIYEYNRVAEQNAEAYQVLMLMDFPAGMTEQSLKLLEQIVTSGPKCGVFTVLYRNEDQFEKAPEKSYSVISNIESSLRLFQFDDQCDQITYEEEKCRLLWKPVALPSPSQTDHIIEILKKGIKSADKVVIGIEKVSKKEDELDDNERSTRNGIRIPIGVRGAQEIQYLTLGVGGSHHALIAGVAGSGKSSLLHTIILQALSQYGPDELQIYLVDFKRGVEFKIYADYKLPTFKVVAIESEREFGYNILKALEREQKIRADMFKKVKTEKIDKIESYRALDKKMPRILVIMDEFQELFSNAGDKIAKESSEMLERIVRQGRAFGIHMILSSQSYANVSGIDKSVYDQMAVRIVLKCSKTDAGMLLGDGSTDIDQISIDDPGRAIYNSEAGNKEYNSHFRVAYIDPSKYKEMLEKISARYTDSEEETRILLSNIEDNKYSIYNQFTEYTTEKCPVLGRLSIGEPLSIVNNLNMDLQCTEYSNMLMIGSDSDKARSMFAFSMLSLAINYWVRNGKQAPQKPFIYFLNYKPLRDDYFPDIPELLATKLLTNYVRSISVGKADEIKDTVEMLYQETKETQEQEQFFLIFGYQRAEELKSEEKPKKRQDILNMMSEKADGEEKSMKEMVERILVDGPTKGIHTILWQDDFKALDIADRKLMTYFYQKIAFDMSKEDFSQFVGVNDSSQMSENMAVYNNKMDDSTNFRPYQSPDVSWIKEICEKLK